MRRSIASLLAALLLTASGGSASSAQSQAPKTSPFDSGGLSQRFLCTVRVDTRAVGCVGEAIPGRSRIRMRSRNPAYDRARGIFSFDVAVENLSTGPLGTPDGKTGVGMKVYHDSIPVVTAYRHAADTGSVQVLNADGKGNYTAVGQSFHAYPGIVAPGTTSAWRRWRYRLSPQVATISFSVRVFTASPQFLWVPELAPGSLPRGVFVPSAVQTAPSGLKYYPGHVSVQFTAQSTAAERTAAIAAIGGTVVGGIRMGADGDYVVRVTDSLTLAPLYRALDLLRARSSVSLATLLFADDGFSYYRPADGAGWTSWSIRADNVGTGSNWGLERIAAPMAWGCSTGGSAVIGVVDKAVDPGSTDVAPNTMFVRALPGIPANNSHGLSVSSIIGALGNNGAGMAGVLWNTRMVLIDVYADVAKPGERLESGGFLPQFAFTNLYEAAVRGAVVINYSANPKFGHVPSDTSRDDRETRDAWDGWLRAALNKMRDAGYHPLVVVSAGNERIDASWSAYPGAKAAYPNQLLVVGASDRLDRPWQATDFDGSAFGANVDIYAPGVEVGGYERDHGLTPMPKSGTSFAAPYVTGVAGLVANFDPSIQSTQLKSYILAGSRLSGKSVDGTPLLNAYDALRYAASKPGAPLCGNRMWKNGDNIVVERDTATLETVVTLAPQEWQSSFISAHHGGRRFDMDWSREFDWASNSRTFVETPYTRQAYSLNGGTFLSYDGTNHDNTAYVTARTSVADSSRVQIEAKLISVQGNSVRAIATSPMISLVAPTNVCEVRDPATSGCISFGPDSDWTDLDHGTRSIGTRVLMAADASDSTRGYVAVNIRQYHAHHDAWAPCEFGSMYWGYECKVSHVSWESAYAKVYRVDFTSGVWSEIPMADNGQSTRANAEIEWLAVNESGTEILWGIGRTTDSGSLCTNQALEYRRLIPAMSLAAGTATRIVPVPDGKVCSGEYEAGATLTPYRGASSAAGGIANSVTATPSTRQIPPHKPRSKNLTAASTLQ